MVILRRESYDYDVLEDIETFFIDVIPVKENTQDSWAVISILDAIVARIAL